MFDTNEILHADEVPAFQKLQRSTVYKLTQDRKKHALKSGGIDDLEKNAESLVEKKQFCQTSLQQTSQRKNEIYCE